MNGLDYTVVAIYLATILAMGFKLREQRSDRDYFLGGRRLTWFPLTLSAMATQLSAISFISAPAFVGFREGGGLQWLAYEFALPLAMLLVMFVIMPSLYRLGVISIYDFLEQRIGRSTRILMSIVFQITRSFATGIMVYAMGIILHTVVGIPFWQSVIVIGVITLIYSLQGGMRAVVYADAIQLGLIVLGLLTCAWSAVTAAGGIDATVAAIDPERLRAIDFSKLGIDGDDFGFWPMLFGGFVLYASYYGCDQVQAQRALSARHLGDVRRLLLANGLLRFPVTLLYCLVGLAIGVAVLGNPDVLARIPAERPDFMMPVFIVEYLPHGVIGLLIVAILSAAMSSLSSTINSLAAVTADDLALLRKDALGARESVRRSRMISLFWGVVILCFSAFGGSIAPTVIEAINKVGSSLYGPALALFLIAILRPGTPPLAANLGLVVGIGINLWLWRFAPQIFWMWWNLIGLVATAAVTSLIAIGLPRRDVPSGVLPQPDEATAGTVARCSAVLVGYFVLIVMISGSFAWAAGR